MSIFSLGISRFTLNEALNEHRPRAVWKTQNVIVSPLCHFQTKMQIHTISFSVYRMKLSKNPCYFI